MYKSRRSKEQQRIIMDLRKSNASQPHKNKSKYSRKVKYKTNFEHSAGSQ